MVDFGVSVVADKTSLTRTGAFVGTAAWISPEQVTGQKLSRASDVFNLGLVLAFAATGRHPYGEGRADAVMYRIAHQTPILAGIEEPLLGAVEACLRQDPARRPSVEALHAFFATDGAIGLPAEPGAAGSTGRETAAAKPKSVGEDRTVIANPSAAKGGPVERTRVVQARPVESQAQSADHVVVQYRTGRRKLPVVLVGAAVLAVAGGASAWYVAGRSDQGGDTSIELPSPSTSLDQDGIPAAPSTEPRPRVTSSSTATSPADTSPSPVPTVTAAGPGSIPSAPPTPDSVQPP